MLLLLCVKKEILKNYLMLPETRRNLRISLGALVLSILVSPLLPLGSDPMIDSFVMVVRVVLLVLAVGYYVVYRAQRKALDDYIVSEMGKSLTPEGAAVLRRDLLGNGRK